MTINLITCTCRGEGISVESETYDGEVWLSFWERGYGPWATSLKDKFKYTWRILRKGHCHADQISLNVDDARAFILALEDAIVKIQLQEATDALTPRKTLEEGTL